MHVAFPWAIGAVTNYTVSIYLTIGGTFGGLYAMASVLRGPRSRALPE